MLIAIEGIVMYAIKMEKIVDVMIHPNFVNQSVSFLLEFIFVIAYRISHLNDFIELLSTRSESMTGLCPGAESWLIMKSSIYTTFVARSKPIEPQNPARDQRLLAQISGWINVR